MAGKAFVNESRGRVSFLWEIKTGVQFVLPIKVLSQNLSLAKPVSKSEQKCTVARSKNSPPQQLENLHKVVLGLPPGVCPICNKCRITISFCNSILSWTGWHFLVSAPPVLVSFPVMASPMKATMEVLLGETGDDVIAWSSFWIPKEKIKHWTREGNWQPVLFLLEDVSGFCQHCYAVMLIQTVTISLTVSPSPLIQIE